MCKNVPLICIQADKNLQWAALLLAKDAKFLFIWTTKTDDTAQIARMRRLV